nr:unnamed protein product [Digitaria exilis]
MASAARQRTLAPAATRAQSSTVATLAASSQVAARNAHRKVSPATLTRSRPVTAASTAWATRWCARAREAAMLRDNDGGGGGERTFASAATMAAR